MSMSFRQKNTKASLDIYTLQTTHQLTMKAKNEMLRIKQKMERLLYVKLI